MTDLLLPPHETYFKEHQETILVPDYVAPPSEPPTKIRQTTLWSPFQRVEHRINKLASFRRPKDLARYLELMGVRGDKHPYHCPIANYLRGGDEDIEVVVVPRYRAVARVYVMTSYHSKIKHRSARYNLPEIGNRFIFRNDFGHYRFLRPS